MRISHITLLSAVLVVSSLSLAPVAYSGPNCSKYMRDTHVALEDLVPEIGNLIQPILKLANVDDGIIGDVDLGFCAVQIGNHAFKTLSLLNYKGVKKTAVEVAVTALQASITTSGRPLVERVQDFTSSILDLIDKGHAESKEAQRHLANLEPELKVLQEAVNFKIKNEATAYSSTLEKLKKEIAFEPVSLDDAPAPAPESDESLPPEELVTHSQKALSDTLTSTGMSRVSMV